VCSSDLDCDRGIGILNALFSSGGKVLLNL
jgi:hypothetical protein